MQRALNATGREIVYSINSPGGQVNVTNPAFANLWRTTPDTSNTYVSMLNTALINNNATALVSGAPGAWNDADVSTAQPAHCHASNLQSCLRMNGCVPAPPAQAVKTVLVIKRCSARKALPHRDPRRRHGRCQGR